VDDAALEEALLRVAIPKQRRARHAVRVEIGDHVKRIDASLADDGPGELRWSFAGHTTQGLPEHVEHFDAPLLVDRYLRHAEACVEPEARPLVEAQRDPVALRLLDQPALGDATFLQLGELVIFRPAPLALLDEDRQGVRDALQGSRASSPHRDFFRHDLPTPLSSPELVRVSPLT
jgi:hypothetical protein